MTKWDKKKEKNIYFLSLEVKFYVSDLNNKLLLHYNCKI
jgi:hypothetical protein